MLSNRKEYRENLLIICSQNQVLPNDLWNKEGISECVFRMEFSGFQLFHVGYWGRRQRKLNN